MSHYRLIILSLLITASTAVADDMSAGAISEEPAAASSASATLQPASGSSVSGTVSFTQVDDGVRAVAEVSGLTAGKHGFHVHEKGDCSDPEGKSAGGHFNPTGAPHGAPDTTARHAGDFGNLTADSSGKARLDVVVKGVALAGPNGLVGRGLIVHADEDDLKTQPTGNAGARVACGVIEATP